MATHEAPRIEVSKPRMFNDKRDAKELDNFLWHMELRQRGVQDLTTTIVVNESLVECRMINCSKPKPLSKGNHVKGEEDKGSQGYTPKKGSSNDPSDNDGKGNNNIKKFTPKINFFLCDDQHSTMVKEKEKEGYAHMESLQLLNTLKAKSMPKMPQHKGLMHVEALEYGKAT
ncbi:hypothetical protein AAG906_012952 [Vitis piasezkii]